MTQLSTYLPLIPCVQNSWMHHPQSTTKFSTQVLLYLSLSVWFPSKQLHTGSPHSSGQWMEPATWFWKSCCCCLFWPIKGFCYSSTSSSLGELAARRSQWIPPYLVWRLPIWLVLMWGLGCSHLSCSPSHIRSSSGVYSRATPLHKFQKLFSVLMTWSCKTIKTCLISRLISTQFVYGPLYQFLAPECHKEKRYPHSMQEAQTILNFFIGRYPIPPATSLKYLGVVITDNLWWSSHIESTCLKAKKQLGLIHWHFHQAPRVASERLYKLTVLPCLWLLCMCLGSPPSKVQGEIELCMYKLLHQKLFRRNGQLLGNIDSQFWNGHAVTSDIKSKNLSWARRL